ncbi:MAG: 2-dehydro-3-deoxygalactonokinase [Rhodospirillaceae bacterium]|nr:2-dehydro-3-deoxygalactonokinase [Rhodospirillaceae bacterium]
MPPRAERPKAALLGLDWGTTSLRGYLIGPGGTILAERAADAGILQIQDRAFAGALIGLAGDWLDRDDSLPIVASGMIGSRQGWVEAPYGEVAAAPGDISLHTLTDFDRPVHVVPGLCRHDEHGVPDVMRGEETQIIGAHDGEMQDGLYLLPGSHSKWARVTAGAITWFATFMTGELFTALKDHTILGRMMAGTAHIPEAFAQGVSFGSRPNSIMRSLFSARTLALFDELGEEDGASYLSGLLIGAEIAEAHAFIPDTNGAPIMIIGNPDLGARYATALSLSGLVGQQAATGAAARGQWRIASAAGILRS